MVDLFNIVEPDTKEEVENDNDEPQELNEENNNGNELRANDCLELENLVTASILDEFPMTTCVRCAAAKSLRTQTYSAWLKKEGLKQAILDIETRWNSTHNMLNRLLELRTFCSVNAKKLLNDHDWDSIHNLKNDLNPGDCFGIWLNTQMKLKKLNTPISKKLLININNRKDSIFQNPVFESALYLDLRYRHLMSEESKSRAVVHLIKTWEMLNRLKNRFSTSTVETEDNSVNFNTYDKRIDDDTDDEFQNSQNQVLPQQTQVIVQLLPLELFLILLKIQPKCHMVRI
ncbi:hypothetical protein ACI65C_013714 [Semiaphis heraclei]